MPLVVLTVHVDSRSRALKMFTYLDGMRTLKQPATLFPQWMLSQKLLEINITDYMECLEFLALFNDISTSEDLVRAGLSFLESSMLFSQDITHLGCPVLQNTFPGLNSIVIPNQMLQSLRIPCLCSIKMTPCLHSAGTL